MSEMTILHLSDIHFKRKENQTFRDDVQSKMMDAIKEHLGKNEMEPDFTAVTGDIAFSGKEYDEAKAFFKELKSILPAKNKFLVVPGNHDVDRDEVDEFVEPYYVVKNNLIDKLLQNPGQIKKKITPKFKAFREFADKLKPKLFKEDDDYFWVKDFKDKKVSFLGLNSSWACEGDKDQLNITLGYPQVMQALKKSKMPNKIVLMHHPPMNWLNETDFNRYSGEIFHHCQLILHGHTHTDNAVRYQSPADSCICIGVNATYTKNDEGFIGFQFIEVEFRQGGVGVKVWPYRLDKRGRNRFVPDFHRWEGQDGPFFELDTFKDKDETKTKNKDERKVTPAPLVIPGEYKDWIKEFHSKMNIDWLAKKGEAITVDLPELYIPIETIVHKKILPESGESFLSGSIDIADLVAWNKRVLLRGGAGMGKTTLIKHLAYTVSTGNCRSSLKGFLPVMVFLKDLWLIFREELKKGERIIVFEDVIKPYLEKSKCKITWDIVSAFLSPKKALFLIDGLDEVPEYLRSKLVDMIAKFQFEHRENHFLITGRPHGIAGEAEKRFGKDLCDINPLDPQKIEDFIKKWFRAISGRAIGLGETTAEAMISDIRGHEHISDFTKNPLLLTAVCILYQDGKRIPEQRADLYNRIIDNLINRRFRDPAHPGSENKIMEFLMALAFDAQEKNRKTIDIDDALGILKNTFPMEKGERPGQHKQRMINLFNEIEPGCGLFDCVGYEKIQFTHLTFQEFLAAKYMVYEEIDWQPRLEKDWWEETLLLYTGLVSLDRKKAANDIANIILTAKTREEKDEEKRLRIQFLGARALCDFQAEKREKDVVSLARDQLIGLTRSVANLRDRFQAGELLGGLGDTRISEDNMVKVPAGDFIRGSNKMGDWEKPEQRIYLDDFMIGVYPVTNQEFKQFVHDNGYHREEFWTTEGWQWRQNKNITEPRYWYDREWNGANFPVVGVSWYEAAAYANWLSAVTKKDYRLPTEAEWEKAVRGTDGRKYLWGNELDHNKCNSIECGLGRTSPVGIFPKGKSPYGCLDMAGNVREWCADWFNAEYYKKSPTKNPIGPSHGSIRVLRGGCWINDASRCRAAYRSADWPGLRDASVGFRLLRSF